jgi:membrane-associated protein
VGYMFGARVGPALFRRPDSRLFRRSHLEKARRYFEEHGPKTIVLARFIPLVRTFAPILAGVGEMPYRTFVVFNVVGGLLWAVGVTTLGYLLGNAIPDIDRYLLPAVALIVAVSFVPVAHELLRLRRERVDRAVPPLDDVQGQAVGQRPGDGRRLVGDDAGPE